MATVYVLLFCRITIGLAFAASVIGKAQDVPAFQEAIMNFHLLPSNWSKVLGWTVLGVEACIMLLMFIGAQALLPGFFLAALLLMAFTVVLALLLWHNKRVVCNCFGRTQRRISPYDALRNILLSGCSLAGIWAYIGLQQSLSAADMILIALMAACFCAVITNMADVVETLRQPFRAL